MKNEFFSQEVWEQAWRESGDAVLSKMKQAGISPVNAFDHKAKTFNEQSFSEEGKKRSRRILNWIEDQGVSFHQASVLDIGAASGVFSVPFAEQGAHVTAVESSLPLVKLLEENTKPFTDNQVNIVPEPFENIDVQVRGWNQAFDLVFASMCPVIYNWESVEKIIQCAKQYCYISMPAGAAENSLANEIWPLISDKPHTSKPAEVAYLMHLLFLKGYSYESLVTRELKTTEVSAEVAMQEMISWFRGQGLAEDTRKMKVVADYLEQAYPAGKVVIHQGGRFAKVLIRLQDEKMYSRN